MCSSNFYHWEIDDETGFRKLILDEVKTNFVSELTKFLNWEKSYKTCTNCKESYPETEYFFTKCTRNKSGLESRCKKCEGKKKFAWGKSAKIDFFQKGIRYCQSCDTIYPLNYLYFSIGTTNGYSSYCKKCICGDNGIKQNINNSIKDTKDNYKICFKCLVELPRTKEYYFKFNRSSDNLESICKKCQNVEYGIVYINKVNKDDLPEGFKYCSHCKGLLPLSSFVTTSKHSDGKSFICSQCLRIIQHQRNDNKKENDYTVQDWYDTKDCFSIDGEYSCAYCGVKESETDYLAMEHVTPFSEGGKFTKDNIIPACRHCNSTKGNRSLDWFFNYSETFTLKRYENILSFIELYKQVSE